MMVCSSRAPRASAIRRRTPRGSAMPDYFAGGPDSSDPAPRRAYLPPETNAPWSFRHGWISGLVSAILGIVGLGTVLCFRFPTLLTMPEIRGHYPVPYIRAALHVVLVTSFLLGTVSLWLRRNKVLGLVGITLTLLAALLGGSQLPVEGEQATGPLLGMDWFLLNLIIYSAVYVPLERVFARHP